MLVVGGNARVFYFLQEMYVWTKYTKPVYANTDQGYIVNFSKNSCGGVLTK